MGLCLSQALKILSPVQDALIPFVPVLIPCHGDDTYFRVILPHRDGVPPPHAVRFTFTVSPKHRPFVSLYHFLPFHGCELDVGASSISYNYNDFFSVCKEKATRKTTFSCDPATLSPCPPGTPGMPRQHRPYKNHANDSASIQGRPKGNTTTPQRHPGALPAVSRCRNATRLQRDRATTQQRSNAATQQRSRETPGKSGDVTGFADYSRSHGGRLRFAPHKYVRCSIASSDSTTTVQRCPNVGLFRCYHASDGTGCICLSDCINRNFC